MIHRSAGLVSVQVLSEEEEEEWDELPLAECVSRVLAADPDLPPISETQAQMILDTVPSPASWIGG